MKTKRARQGTIPRCTPRRTSLTSSLVPPQAHARRQYAIRTGPVRESYPSEAGERLRLRLGNASDAAETGVTWW